MAEKLVLLGETKTTVIDDKRRKVVNLPGSPSKDFIITAKCRVMKIGTRISIEATDLPGETGGTYTWSTTSSNIRLVNSSGPTLAVEALKIGAARDSEKITCTRKSIDGETSEKTVSLTVADVIFTKSDLQNYGFDDFDTATEPNDNHINLKSSAETFIRVKISGGALGTDFYFESDNTNAITIKPPSATAEFDLSLVGGRAQKTTALLTAKVKCPSAQVFASVAVHIYSEKVVKVLVAKVADSRSVSTTLTYSSADYAGHQIDANNKLREAVVKYELQNFNSGQVADIPFDTDLNGALSYDINAGGGPEFELIKRTITRSSPDQFRVVIVRSMKSFYYLERAARKGDTTLVVKGSNVFHSSMPLGIGPNRETVRVLGNSGNVASLAAPLAFDHVAGESLEFPAAGWGSDPIIIMEGSASLDVTKWTILHEVGHTALTLMDIVDRTDFMHYDQSNTDYRLRFCPRVSQYRPGIKENQWEKIPRPTSPRL